MVDLGRIDGQQVERVLLPRSRVVIATCLRFTTVPGHCQNGRITVGKRRRRTFPVANYNPTIYNLSLAGGHISAKQTVLLIGTLGTRAPKETEIMNHGQQPDT